MTSALPEIEEDDDARQPHQQLLGWAQTPDGKTVSEADLPALLAVALAYRKAEHPDRTMRPAAFRVFRDGEETSRVGPQSAPAAADSLVALSVIVTVADDTGLHVTGYTLALEEQVTPSPQAVRSRVARKAPATRKAAAPAASTRKAAANKAQPAKAAPVKKAAPRKSRRDDQRR